jgi:hypothetical protein
VVTEGAGRDPLGLSRVSELLTNNLIPGITTTTSRARYYSFYAWAVEDIDMSRKAGKQPVPFDDELQVREATFALASKIGAQTSLPIVGSRMVDAKLREGAISGEVDASFRVLPSNSGGGFDQYYKGCLQDLGLVSLVDGQWSATTGIGRKVADAFRSATRGARCLKGNWQTRGPASVAMLRESAETFSLDAVGGLAAAGERELLV